MSRRSTFFLFFFVWRPTPRFAAILFCFVVHLTELESINSHSLTGPFLVLPNRPILRRSSCGLLFLIFFYLIYLFFLTRFTFFCRCGWFVSPFRLIKGLERKFIFLRALFPCVVHVARLIGFTLIDLAFIQNDQHFSFNRELRFVSRFTWFRFMFSRVFSRFWKIDFAVYCCYCLC